MDYKTESKRFVPANEEESYLLYGDQVKKNTVLQMQIYALPKFFRWIKETDTEEPFCNLSDAIMEFLSDMDFLNAEDYRIFNEDEDEI